MSGDLISRQAVLDLLFNSYIKTELTSIGYASKEYAELCVDELNELPSVNPQEPKTGHWIPVSERLPEDKTYVLTTIKVPNRVPHARSGWYEGGFFHNDNGDTWKATDIEVKAWMPLPEPYKAGGEDA